MADLARLEKRVDEQQEDLHTLITQVTKLSTIVEAVEKRHDEERIDMRALISEVRKLSEYSVSARALEKEFIEVKNELSKYSSDIAVLKQGQEFTVTLKTKIQNIEKNMQDQLHDIKLSIQSNEANISNLLTVKLKQDGAREALGKAAAVFWAIFGGVFTLAAVAIFMTFMRMYFGLEISPENTYDLK